jgi:hypothetical protein
MSMSHRRPENISVTLDLAAKGSFTTLNGFVNAGGGTYTFSGTARGRNDRDFEHGVQTTPNQVAPGGTETTTLTVTVNNGIPCNRYR